MIMAATGLQRLGLEEKITEIIDLNVMLPAVSQGAIGIETRINDTHIDSVMHGINHEETMLITTAERAYLKSMEGGCQIPIGCYSSIFKGEITFTGLVADLKGEKIIKITKTGNLQNAKEIAIKVSDDMIAEGAAEILDEIRNNLS
jgi:hydroxymethylbilane synthase